MKSCVVGLINTVQLEKKTVIFSYSFGKECLNIEDPTFPYRIKPYLLMSDVWDNVFVVQVVFLVKGPIYLVCISCTEEPFESLKGQLELIYGQVSLIASLTNLFFWMDDFGCHCIFKAC